MEIIMDDGSKEFAQRMIEYMKLTPLEVLKSLGYTPSEITQYTYLYIDDDGKLAGMEKKDVNSYPADEHMPIGYVRSWVGGVKEAKENLDTILTAGEATELYGLASATVRQAIKRGNIPARKSGGTWLLRRSDAEELWGARCAR